MRHNHHFALDFFNLRLIAKRNKNCRIAIDFRTIKPGFNQAFSSTWTADSANVELDFFQGICEGRNALLIHKSGAKNSGLSASYKT